MNQTKQQRAETARKLAREDRDLVRTHERLSQEQTDTASRDAYLELAEETRLRARALDIYAALILAGAVS